MYLPDDIYETDIGAIAWPHLVKPHAPIGSGVKARYCCCLLFDFPDDIMIAAKTSIYPKYAAYWPIRNNAEINKRYGEPTWFKWRLHASSEAFVASLGLDDRLIAPGDIRAGDRARLGVTFYEYIRQDNKRRGVAAKLRYVRRIGGPIRGEDV